MIIKRQGLKKALGIVSAMFVLSAIGWAMADVAVAEEAAPPNSQSAPTATTTSTSTTTTTTIPPLDKSLCESTYVPSDAKIAEGSLKINNRENLVKDCEALVAIRNHFITHTPNLSPNHFLRKWGTLLSIEGDPTNPTKQIGFWPGIRIENISVNSETQTRVTAIHLSNPDLISDATMKLSGSLPMELILKLTELRSLHLSNNKLTGSISDEEAREDEFGKKTDDKVKLGNMLELILDNNELTGSIPDNIGNLEDLETLNLSNNKFSGSITPNLGKLTKLFRLMLNNNQLTGSIPALDTLTKLKVANFSSNKLTSLTGGTQAFDKLTKLRWIDLSNNQLTGSIPSLDKLTKLSLIRLSNSGLTGTMPSLDKLTELRWIDLSNSDLLGSIPSLVKLTKLKLINLSYNGLTGSIPALPNPTPSTPTQLTSIDFSGNRLSADITELELDKLTKLESINLSDNLLTGSIPELDKLTELRLVDLSDNRMSGAIPSFTKLIEIESIDLSNNSLTGNLTTQFNNLTKLESLDLSDNSLSGSTPANICSLGTKTKLTNSGLTACS